MSKSPAKPARKAAPVSHKAASKVAATAPRKRRAPARAPADAAQSGASKAPADLYGATESAVSDIEMETERLGDSEETLPELEREIGMADWIDPLTGEPAEGQSPPHLEEE